MVINDTDEYSDPGILITDDVNLNLSISVISILKDSVELLTSPISISNLSSYVTYYNNATYIITYVGKDNAGNLSNSLQRTVNVIILPFTMTLKPMTISNFDSVYSFCDVAEIAYTNKTYMVSLNVYINSKNYPAYLTSTDSADWKYNNYFVTYFSGLSLQANILRLVGANDRFIMIIKTISNNPANDLLYTFSSNDGGVSWTLITTSNDKYSLDSIRTVNNIFFYNLSNSPYTGYRSLDGITWTQCTGTRVDNYGLMYAYGNGIYVSASRAGHVIISTDGINWNTNVALRGYVIESYEEIRNIAFGNGKFILTNYDTYVSPPTGTNYILYSINGITWTRVELPYYNNNKLMGSSRYTGISSIFYHKNKFIMQLYDNYDNPNTTIYYVFTSYDEIDWKISTFNFSTSLSGSYQNNLNKILFYPTSKITKTGSNYYLYFINGEHLDLED